MTDEAKPVVSPPRVVINLTQSEKKRWESHAFKDGLDSAAAWAKRLIRLHIREREEKFKKADVRPPEPKW